MAYSDQVKERAYQIWAFESNQNPAETARRLADDIPEMELGISDPVNERTIRNWARDPDLDWEGRAAADIFAGAKFLRHRAQSTLALASPEAAAVLRETMRLNPHVERHIVLKGPDGTYVETVTEFDANIQKLRVQAAQAIVDRTGFSPIGTRETGNVDPPPSTMLVDSERLHEIVKIADPEQREREMQRLENEARGALEADSPRERKRVSAGRIDRS
jgi:ribosomal protein S6